MTARLAFIRGINVGGNRQLPMAELRRTMSEREFGNVRTYIQSGNVVYDAPAGSNDAPGTLRGEGAQITAAIEDTRGFAPSRRGSAGGSHRRPPASGAASSAPSSPRRPRCRQRHATSAPSPSSSTLRARERRCWWA